MVSKIMSLLFELLANTISITSGIFIGFYIGNFVGLKIFYYLGCCYPIENLKIKLEINPNNIKTEICDENKIKNE
uniref:Uncharacterized protein n=1 Tax=viral metagenome TaxID=1070528 RepID=A0A6C0H6I2_9ZZZZ